MTTLLNTSPINVTLLLLRRSKIYQRRRRRGVKRLAGRGSDFIKRVKKIGKRKFYPDRLQIDNRLLYGNVMIKYFNCFLIVSDFRLLLLLDITT